MEMMLEVMMGVLVMDFDKVAQFGGQISNQCKWRHLVARFITNTDASGSPGFLLVILADTTGSKYKML